ncbi:MAG: GtrA family protein [Firmicutes bacterium]|nr:GtrA family protein [Bacillota bacterium]
MTQSAFWRVYLLASVCSSLISVLLFHWFDVTIREPYEASAVLAGLLTLPINWLVGEQLTWCSGRANRAWRACKYFGVYGVGLLLDALIVHLLGHVALWDGRLADLVGITVAMLWTAPMNRYVTWRADVCALVSDSSA